MRSKHFTLIALSAALAFPLSATNDGYILAVTGDVPMPQNYTLSDIKSLPQANINITENGTEVAYQGVTLTDFLTRSGAPLGVKYRSAALMIAVVVHASDGSQALFSLPEAGGVMLAWSQNTQPLAPHVGPLQLITSGSNHARWLRQVTAIQLVKLNVPAITNAADVPPPGIAAPK